MAFKTRKEKMMIIAYTEDGTTKHREATAEEITEIELLQKEAQTLKAEQDAAAEQRATDKAALFERLGITADEAELLLA